MVYIVQENFMKKSLYLSIFSLILVFAFVFPLIGCSKKKNEKSSNDQSGIISNGGMVVQKGNKLYFVGGLDDVSSSGSKTINSAIYEVDINENGDFVSDPQVFVSSITGFEYGSLFIFGNYLYYASPSKSKNSQGEILYGITEFYRKRLDGKKTQKLYSTESNDETEISYSYYPVGEKDLFLLVYQASLKTIVSIDVGTNPKTKTIAKDVTGVVFAENGNLGGANKYVFYTRAKDKEDDDQTGNVVVRLLPDGSDYTILSENKKTYSLLCIRNDRILYSENDIIYSSDGENSFSKTDKLVSMLATSSYSDIILNDDYIIVKNDNDTIIYISWQNGEMTSFVICEADCAFLCENNGYLFFIEDEFVYSVKIEEQQTALKLCNQKAQDLEGYIVPEIVGDYFYFINSEDSKLIYRTNAFATETQDASSLIK